MIHPHIHRITSKLETLWLANPTLRFGQLVESVEDTAWDLIPQRVCSPRLMWLGDDAFEAALDRRLPKPTSL